MSHTLSFVKNHKTACSCGFIYIRPLMINSYDLQEMLSNGNALLSLKLKQEWDMTNFWGLLKSNSKYPTNLGDNFMDLRKQHSLQFNRFKFCHNYLQSAFTKIKYLQQEIPSYILSVGWSEDWCFGRLVRLVSWQAIRTGRWVRSWNRQTDGQTDGQTDRIQYHSNLVCFRNSYNYVKFMTKLMITKIGWAIKLPIYLSFMIY